MNRFILPAAATTLLMLGGRAASAADLPYQSPATQKAEQSADLIARAGHALTGRLQRHGQAISNVWIFPTDDPKSVFVSYSTAHSDHLQLVEMQGARIAKVRDLTKLGSGAALLASTRKP
jgi:hypothetical protein